MLPDNSELITLRLELGRERDRADAFQKAMTTEVLKVVRVAIMQATIDADEEIARLKDENERLRKTSVESFTLTASDIISMTEDGVQDRPFHYTTKYTVTVDRRAYIALLNMMSKHWHPVTNLNSHE